MLSLSTIEELKRLDDGGEFGIEYQLELALGDTIAVYHHLGRQFTAILPPEDLQPTFHEFRQTLHHLNTGSLDADICCPA